MQLEGGERPECSGQREGSPVEGTWGGSTWHRAGHREPKRTEEQGRRRQAGSGCWWQRLSRRVPQKLHFSGWPGAHAGHLHASCRVGIAGPSGVPRAGPVRLAEGPAGRKQQCWHRKGGALARGGRCWPVRGLVPAAAGVGARLARGEVFGSHAGGVLEERGKEGPGSGGFLARAEQPAASLMWSLAG